MSFGHKLEKVDGLRRTILKLSFRCSEQFIIQKQTEQPCLEQTFFPETDKLKQNKHVQSGHLSIIIFRHREHRFCGHEHSNDKHDGQK